MTKLLFALIGKLKLFILDFLCGLKNIYGMAKGFTIKRTFSMIGNGFTKEEILGLNASLNKVKKPKK